MRFLASLRELLLTTQEAVWLYINYVLIYIESAIAIQNRKINPQKFAFI